MKKILSFVLILFAVIVLLALGAFVIIPKDMILENAVNEIRYYTGREFQFSDAKFKFWPNLGVELKNVHFSNMQNAKYKNMFSAENLDLAIAVKPLLLDKTIEVKKFYLKEPKINIEYVSADNNSLYFIKQLENENTNTNAKPKAENEEQEELQNKAEYAGGFKFKFGKFQIENGSLNFVDIGNEYSLESANLIIDMHDLQSVFNLSGDFIYNSKKVLSKISIDNISDIAEGGVSKGILDFEVDNSKALIKGTLSSKVEKIDLNVDLNLKGIADIAAWLNNGEPVENIAFNRLKLLSGVKAEKNNITLTNADFELDDFKAIGDLDIDLLAHPNVFARLTADKVNVDNIIKKFKNKPDEAASESDVKKVSGDNPIDISFLNKFDADIELSANSLTLGGENIGKTKIYFTLKDGNMDFSNDYADAFGGRILSQVNVNSAYGIPSASLVMKVQNVNAKSSLSKLFKFNKLSGNFSSELDLKSKGRTKNNLLENLNGRATFDLSNGVIEGMDLPDIVKKSQLKLSDFNIGVGNTSFSKLEGSFVVTNGVAENKNLLFESSVLKVTGEGTVYLPLEKYRFKLTPVLQINDDANKNLSIPLNVSGTYSELKIEPDFRTIVEKVIDNPAEAKEKVKETVEAVKEKAKEVKEEIKQTMGETLTDEIKKDPVKAIKNFLGDLIKVEKPTSDDVNQ